MGDRGQRRVDQAIAHPGPDLALSTQSRRRCGSSMRSASINGTGSWNSEIDQPGEEVEHSFLNCEQESFPGAGLTNSPVFTHHLMSSNPGT